MRPVLTTVTFSTPDPRSLARFYQRLLGGEIGADEAGWATLRDPGGGVALGFHVEPGYVPPVWPAEPAEQQLMMHLELRVNDLDAATAHALECGATVAGHQPQDDVRVCLDPVGHPFCLYL